MQVDGSFKLSDDVIKGLIAGAAGLVGTLITAAITWARDRDVSSQRLRLLDEESKRLTFWDAWLKIQVSITTSEAELSELRERVRAEASAAAALVKGAFQQPISESAAPSTLAEYSKLRNSLPRWRRWSLLYKPARTRAWIPRVLFYMFAVEGIVLVIVSWGDKEELSAIVIGVLFWVFLFRSLSVWLEKPRFPTAGQDVST
jgi:hypothetical protein